MSEYEARIKTKFGELTIHFKDKADLEKKLAQVTEFTTTIEKEIGHVLVKEPEKVVPEFADLYTVSPDGLIKLLKYPKKNADILRLALFLSHSALASAQLKQATGIDNPIAYMGKDFIANPDGTYSIDPNARAKVTNKIIPSLRGEKKTK
jgi:hypothetical protein